MTAAALCASAVIAAGVSVAAPLCGAASSPPREGAGRGVAARAFPRVGGFLRSPLFEFLELLEVGQALEVAQSEDLEKLR